MARPKVKLIIDPRNEHREVEGKVYRVGDFDLTTGEIVRADHEVLYDAMEGAQWSDDPGTGHSILLEDGRELPNPIPIAPPISVTSEPSVNELVERALARHFSLLQANDEIDTIEDADDFGDDDEFFPGSQYEIILRDEAPAIPAMREDSSTIEEVEALERSLPAEPIPKKKPKPPKEVPASRLDEEEA